MLKTYSNEVQSLLATALDSEVSGIYVWEGVVPETADLPAVSWHSIGYTDGRDFTGDRLNDKMSFRVVIVANNTASINEICNTLGDLDNTSNDDFQRIFVVGNRLEPKETGVTVRRFMLDLNLTV